MSKTPKINNNINTDDDTKQKKSLVTDIVNSVMSKAYSFNTGECAIFKRAAGKRTDELDISTSIFFLSLFDNKFPEELRADDLKNAILVGLEILCLQKLKSGDTSFKTQTAQLYKTNKASKNNGSKPDSCTRRIEGVVKSRKDGNIRFYRDIVNFCQYLGDKSGPVNVSSLILDIYNWDSSESKTWWIKAFSNVV